MLWHNKTPVLVTAPECEHRDTHMYSDFDEQGRGSWWEQCRDCDYVVTTGVDA